MYVMFDTDNTQRAGLSDGFSATVTCLSGLVQPSCERCEQGKSDVDTDPATPCVACPTGTYDIRAPVLSSTGCFNCKGPVQPPASTGATACPSEDLATGVYATAAEAYATTHYFYDATTSGVQIDHTDWVNPLNTWNHDDGTFDVELPFAFMWYTRPEHVISVGTNGLASRLGGLNSDP